MSEIDDMLKAAGAPPRKAPAQNADDTTHTDPGVRGRVTGRTEDTPKEPKRSREPKAKGGKETTLPRPDRYILAMYFALCIISVIELYSASSRDIDSGNIIGPLFRHSLMLLGGIALCMFVSRIKVRYFIPLAPIFTIISVLMMVYVLFNGNIINGARRCFIVFGIQVQPAEFLKISAVMIIAYIMAKNQQKGGVKTRAVVLCALIVLMFGALLFSQGLTNTILLMGISVPMMLVGGLQWRKFGMLLVCYGLIAGAAMYVKMSGDDEGYTPEQELIMNTGKDAEGNRTTADRKFIWANRMDRFWNDSIPKYEQPITAQNRQEMYSYMAQANGGLLGVFPGNSRETARLPLAFSDYIYSIVVEDLGFVGGMFLLLIYMSLLARAGTIAWRCDRVYPAMLVMGMAVMIAMQALFHMAIVTGVFPVSGQPLPMISKGGTSILITSLAFGIMLSVSRYASGVAQSKKQSAASDLPTDMAGLNPSQIKK